MFFRNSACAVCAASLILSSPIGAQEFIVPISANSPHVFLSLTDERDIDDTSFFSVPNAPPNGEGLPVNADDHYEVAIFDTGAPATIISNDAFRAFGVQALGRAGANITPLGGVGPTVEAINSDPLGVYAVGFDGLLTDPGTGRQAIDRSQLKGSFNDSILYGPGGSQLPNLVGTTTSSHYTTVINYSDPRIIEFNGDTHRSPAVTMLDLGGISPPSRRIGLTIVPGQLGPVPTFLPDLGNLDINDLGNNPSSPTIAGSFWLRANVRNNNVSRTGLEAIFDTGAQGSFVSEQIAAEMGFDVENDKPDFVVRIAGVTGVSEEVPGFYAEEFILPGTDGGLVLNEVPLIVFNLTDPRDGVNTLDALIGMNLFAGRDLTLNPQPGNAYLGVSDPALPFHRWVSQAASSDWDNFQNWEERGIPALDWYAEVRNVSGTPQVAQVTSDSLIAQLVTGDRGEPAANQSMTVSISEDTTLTIFGSAIIQNGSTVHLDSGTLAPLAVEIRGGALSGTGTVEGEVLSQGELVPGGVDAIGSLHFAGSLDQLSQGVLKIELGDSSERPDLQFDKLTVEGAMTIDGKLEILTTDAYSQPDRGMSDLFTIIQSESEVLGEFSEYTWDGVLLEREFPLTTDRRAFRDHLGNGQFLTVSYANRNSMSVRNEQALLGDANGDGEVAFDDFIALASNYEAETDWTGGDFNGDGVALFGDFLALANNYGRTVGFASAGLSSAASVPEPATWVLLALGVATLSTLRKQKAARNSHQ